MKKNVLIQVNSDCNLNCPYCYSKNNFKVDKEKIKQSIKSISDFCGMQNITFTGGEPLLEYDFLIELLEVLRELNVRKIILTNGLLLDGEKIRKLRELGADIKVSLDSFKIGIKKANDNLIRLIKDNNIKLGSKVITKENLAFLYEDFIRLTEIGFNDIDIIPEMYVFWSDDEIEELINGIKKIQRFCKEKNIRTNFSESPYSGNNYFKCDKIKILPDGDLSLCGSLNLSRKTGFIKSENIRQFEDFKKKIVSFALESYKKKPWFKEEYLDNVCLIDAFYHNYINNIDDRWLQSSIKLFSRIKKMDKDVEILDNKRFRSNLLEIMPCSEKTKKNAEELLRILESFDPYNLTLFEFSFKAKESEIGDDIRFMNLDSNAYSSSSKKLFFKRLELFDKIIQKKCKNKDYKKIISVLARFSKTPKDVYFAVDIKDDDYIFGCLGFILNGIKRDKKTFSSDSLEIINKSLDLLGFKKPIINKDVLNFGFDIDEDKVYYRLQYLYDKESKESLEGYEGLIKELNERLKDFKHYLTYNEIYDKKGKLMKRKLYVEFLEDIKNNEEKIKILLKRLPYIDEEKILDFLRKCEGVLSVLGFDEDKKVTFYIRRR